MNPTALHIKPAGRVFQDIRSLLWQEYLTIPDEGVGILELL
jgi:hypothetical protein